MKTSNFIMQQCALSRSKILPDYASGGNFILFYDRLNIEEVLVMFSSSGVNRCTGVTCPRGYTCEIIDDNNFRCKGG